MSEVHLLVWVWLASMNLMVWFEAHVEVHVGSIDKEDDDEQGIAHMIEHVAFLGSKKRRKLTGTGARSNAYMNFHNTMLYIHSPTCSKDSGGDLLPPVLDMLNEIVFHPQFLASRVEKERRAILSELQMMNKIEYRVDCQLLQHLHSENKLGKRLPVGLEEQIKKLDVDKMRKFHELWYFPANATLYIVGDIDSISKSVYHNEAAFGQTCPGNETVTTSIPSAFCGNLSQDRSVISLEESKILQKERHAVCRPVVHNWSIPRSNEIVKPPQIFQHELLQDFSINMFCKVRRLKEFGVTKVMDHRQRHESLVAVTGAVTLEEVNSIGAKVLEFVADFGKPSAPHPTAIVACVLKKVHDDERASGAKRIDIVLTVAGTTVAA